MTVADVQEVLLALAPPFHEPAAEHLLRTLAFRAIRAGDVKQLRDIAAHPVTPLDVLLLLCHEPECRDILGHRKEPRPVLEALAEAYAYPEAILTVGLDLFRNADESVAAFKSFLDRHGDDLWLLETLVRARPSCEEKADVLSSFVAIHPQAASLIKTRDIVLDAARAELTTAESEIRDLFAKGEPHIWRSLAANPHTPGDLLSQLSQVRDVKCAREIRRRALASLERK